MHHFIIRLLVALFCCLPALTAAATTQSIHVEWGYTPPSAPAVTGFKLYQEGVFACQTQDPNATTMDCQVSLVQETTNFTLTAIFSDGTESPHSTPFPFTIASSTTKPSATGSNLIVLSWDYPTSTAITGFRAYQNSGLIGETNDPTVRSLNCITDLPSGTVSYTLTAVNSDGTETTISNTLTYTPDITVTPGTTELKAAITASTTSGPAPLSVEFNASTSTGTITSYLWDFGDGSTATPQTVNHQYVNAGTYTAKLTIANTTTGNTSTTTIAVTASAVAEPDPIPPTAVISSSAATGQAPLTVSFDGSGSTATNATLASYNWSFGDGSSATGASVSHAYTTAGTYSATLTVTDSKGLTSQVSTPVIVTAPTITNKAPQAVISATTTSGSVPLTVTFNGDSSSDSDGSISSYVWNFGDGSTATGKSVIHTYITEATFTATLQVTDNQGATGSSNVTITVKTETPTTEVKIETGEVTVSSEWVRVPLTSTPTFTNPIVIAGPPSFNNSEPCVVRLRNIDKTGFDIKLSEWNYLDGTHPQETISYLVMEKGRHTLPNGSIIEAGSFTGTTSFKTVTFSAVFPKTPVVLTTVASVKEADTISGRMKNIGPSSFAYYFREQEKNINKHLNETINFIAWEPSKGTIGSMQYEVAKTANAVTNAWYSGTYQSSFSQPPLLLADMQTTADTDTSALRVQQQTATGFQMKAEEEQSKDSEVTHPTETVGYIALNQPEEKVLASFTWEFDAAQEAAINGFQILANGEPICTSDAPTARQLSCEITKPTTTTAFTIQAIEKTGGYSTPSNNITYTP